MASTKLSAEDKQAIVELYQEVGQTAATVAKQYGVSVSTISRLLKSELPAETYEALVRQKRGGGETKSKKRTSRKRTVSKLKKNAAVPEPEVMDVDVAEVDAAESEASLLEVPSNDSSLDGEAAESSGEAPRSRRRRTRSSVEKKKPVSRRKSRTKVKAASEETTPEIEAPNMSASFEMESADEPEMPQEKSRQPIKRTKPKLKHETDGGVDVEASTGLEESEQELAAEEVETQPRRRTRRRSRARAVEEEESKVIDVVPESGPEDAASTSEQAAAQSRDLALDVLNDALENDDEGFDDAFDDDDDLDEDEGGHDNITALRRRPSGVELVQIQPLSEANLSRMLYLVIDRTADLITMPMVFFRDLGQLPEEEEEKKTLPVFDNHRVARRFSQRNQRVIKVPDGQLISKTAPWLEAKGITRCLLDGQVYSLESVED